MRLIHQVSKRRIAPGFWESMIPIWGPVKQSAHDFDCGKNFWGAVNLGLAVRRGDAASAIGGLRAEHWKTGGDCVEKL